jgi:dihydroorotate dehydrogenase
MSSINIVNHNNKLNESGKVKSRIAETKLSPSCGDDSLEVLSSYDNDSGNDEFDEKGDRFASFSYSSSDGGDRKFRCNNNYNSLPLMRVKRHNVTANFNSMKRKHFNRSAIEQEPFHDDIKVINLSSPSPSCGSWSSDSNMLQQTFNNTKSSSVPILVKSDQFNEDFNKLTVSINVAKASPPLNSNAFLLLGFTEFTVSK